jgi:hypothetical protein
VKAALSVPNMPHPGARCAHTEDGPLPRPAVTPSHHMQVAGLYGCVSAVLPLAHHQGSCQAPSLLQHSYHSGSSHVCIHLHGVHHPIGVATPAGCMHMPPTVCPLLEPTDRHAGHSQRHKALLYSFMSIADFITLDPHLVICLSRSLVIQPRQRFSNPSQDRVVLWRACGPHSLNKLSHVRVQRYGHPARVIPLSRSKEALVPTPGDERRHHSTASRLEGSVAYCDRKEVMRMIPYARRHAATLRSSPWLKGSPRRG